MKGTIATDLLAWFDANKRDMPWRATRDPYAIWISEVMLQQTQVDTVRPYWERFLARFPAVRELARAPLDDLLKAWEGLGYYSRARNLQAAARQIVACHHGRLPADVAGLRALTGVGPYTAGAIASIAFGLPEPAVDGNAVRVLSRLHAVTGDVARPTIRAQLEDLARSLLAPGSVGRDRPGDVNQALMELGALVCTPRSPHCHECPLRTDCRALERGLADQLPVKRKKTPPPYADIAVAVCLGDERVLVARRPEGGLLGGLLGFPAERLEADEAVAAGITRALGALGIHAGAGAELLNYPFVFSSLRTTQHVHVVRHIRGTPTGTAFWADRAALEAMALPTALAPVRDRLLASPSWSSV